MAGLETVQDYIDEARRLLQDAVAPYRYPDDDLLEALNIGLMETFRLRSDLFLPSFVIPSLTAVDTTPVTFDRMYRSALVYYIVGRAQLRDDEQTQDARAASLLTKFVAQLLQVGA